MTTLTPLPTPPTTADPSTFSARADALLAALPVMVEEINGAGALTAGNATTLLNKAFNTAQGLTCFLKPSMSDGWRGIYRAGFGWWSENQQWGGPFGFMNLLDGATGTLCKGEAATGYVESSSSTSVGDAAGTTYFSTGFMVAETQTVSAVWVKLYKTGNPANNLGVFIYSDTAGSPNALITNGTATAQNGKLHTSDSNGQWYRFAFATPPSVAGGTQYHIVLKSSGAVDASNYWNPMLVGGKKYPFGFRNYGSAVPAWTQQTTNSGVFLVELSASAQMLESAGIFDGKLQGGGDGASGTLCMSRGLVNKVPLHEIMDVTDFTITFRGAAFTKDKTIWDTGYGQDHSRWVLRCDATTGYPSFHCYDSAGTHRSVTGTVDISSGNHQITLRGRAKNDGSDTMVLRQAGVSVGTPVTGASIAFDTEFAQHGTMWLLGGFNLPPTWSVSSIGINGFSALPSTLGWTFTSPSGATEANMYSVSGGKLFQNANGDTGSQDGYYALTIVGVNATGSFSSFKVRVAKSTNTKGTYGCYSDHNDGTRRVISQHAEYFLADDAGTISYYPQFDGKSYENVIEKYIKGTEAHIYRNHGLLVDDTGNASASGTNGLRFGDNSTTAGEKADAVWSAAKYYVGGGNAPQFTAGSISELAIWQGDRTGFDVNLYNSGTFVSVQEFCGIERNCIDKSGKLPKVRQIGITANPTTASAVMTDVPEMSMFVIGEEIDARFSQRTSNSNTGEQIYLGICVDGENLANTVTSATQDSTSNTSTAGYNVSQTVEMRRQRYLGLHKVAGQWSTTLATSTGFARQITVESKP